MVALTALSPQSEKVTSSIATRGLPVWALDALPMRGMGVDGGIDGRLNESVGQWDNICCKLTCALIKSSQQMSDVGHGKLKFMK